MVNFELDRGGNNCVSGGVFSNAEISGSAEVMGDGGKLVSELFGASKFGTRDESSQVSSRDVNQSYSRTLPHTVRSPR